MATELSWGRSYLMCPPDHFGVTYSINPWMDPHVRVDGDRARAQWDALVTTLRFAGASVEVLEARPGLPDMVFTANHGIATGSTFLRAEMRTPQRAAEPDHTARWFAVRGWRVASHDAGAVQEGIGDALPLGGAVVAGTGQRSNVAAVRAIAAAGSCRVVPVRLPDPRWYHMDLALCPLDERRAIVHPAAFDAAGRAAVARLVDEPLVLDDDEASTFAANSVVVGRTVVMPDCPVRVGRQLEAWGFDVAVVDVSEIEKAGGAVRCMTLPLDLDLAAVAACSGIDATGDGLDQQAVPAA